MLTATWMDMKMLCKESKKRLNKSIESLKSKNEKTIHDIVDLSIEREMRRDVTEVQRIIEQKLLYEFNTLSEEDIRNARLTEKEVRVARLRQEKSIREIAEELNCSGNTVFKIYRSALKKIERYKKINKSEKIKNQLSMQQKKIYKLMNMNKSNREIAEILNISINTVKVQKNRIRKILGGLTKYSKK